MADHHILHMFVRLGHEISYASGGKLKGNHYKSSHMNKRKEKQRKKQETKKIDLNQAQDIAQSLGYSGGYGRPKAVKSLKVDP